MGNRIAALEAELENERMRLAACGVAALSDTTGSMESQRLSPDSPYHSASYGDVLRRTRECIDLRAKVAALEAARRKIAAYSPGDFRTLADEIAIWKIATEVLETELPLSARAEQGIIDQCFPEETPAQSGSGACKACGYFQGAHSHCLNPDCPSKIKGN